MGRRERRAAMDEAKLIGGSPADRQRLLERVDE
jgi:hypothetical protein